MRAIPISLGTFRDCSAFRSSLPGWRRVAFRRPPAACHCSGRNAWPNPHAGRKPPANRNPRSRRHRARAARRIRSHPDDDVADDQPGHADLRQSELAESRRARADAARGLRPAREDHPFRPRAHPERIVHARGSGAHGYFQPTKSMRHLTRRRFLQDPQRRRGCSCASRPWPAAPARSTCRATCAASR